MITRQQVTAGSVCCASYKMKKISRTLTSNALKMAAGWISGRSDITRLGYCRSHFQLWLCDIWFSHDIVFAIPAAEVFHHSFITRPLEFVQHQRKLCLHVLCIGCRLLKQTLLHTHGRPRQYKPSLLQEMQSTPKQSVLLQCIRIAEG